MTRTSAQQLIERFGLEDHIEGGHYRRIFRSKETVVRRGETRSALTSIYFLLTRGQHGRWHEVASDEAWHFLAGDPLELLVLDPDGPGGIESILLGPVELPDTVPSHVVPAGIWQAARPTGEFGLAGCTVGPGFEFSDFRFVRDIPGHEVHFSDLPANRRALL